MDISQREAEGTMRALARVEGIFAGPSSGGAISAALRLSAKLQDATIVAIVCDRGDRYLSTGKPWDDLSLLERAQGKTAWQDCMARLVRSMYQLRCKTGASNVAAASGGISAQRLNSRLNTEG